MGSVATKIENLNSRFTLSEDVGQQIYVISIATTGTLKGICVFSRQTSKTLINNSL